ncbi:hypothetical protein Ancab_018597 [Ancistrocladus abbreviatus]
MASLKAEKPIGTQLLGQAKKEPAGTKPAEGSPAKAPAASKPAPKKAAQKPQEPKSKGKPGQSAGKQ